MVSNRDAAAGRPSLLRLAAMAVGAVFLLVGILGFVPGIVTNYSELSAAGHDSMAKLLGLFQVSVLHNIVHLLFGVAGLALARRNDTARLYLIGGGVIYLVLWIYGLVIDQTSSANFVPINTADNWLHFGLGVGMIALGVALSRALVPGRTVRRRADVASGRLPRPAVEQAQTWIQAVGHLHARRIVLPAAAADLVLPRLMSRARTAG